MANFISFMDGTDHGSIINTDTILKIYSEASQPPGGVTSANPRILHHYVRYIDGSEEPIDADMYTYLTGHLVINSGFSSSPEG